MSAPPPRPAGPDPARPGLRYELKLACDEGAWPELTMHLRLDRAGIRTLFPTRTVQTLYLDTTYGRLLQENLAGISERAKLRLRWYGEAERGVAATMEKKCRENSMGWKETLRIEGPLDVAGAERRPFMAELLRRCDARWRARLAAYEPVQWVRYRRAYLTTADRRVRLTLDRELAFADQRPLARLGMRARTPAPRVMVIELKCLPDDLEHARELLDRLPIPLGRCSKFVLAAEPSSGPLPSQLEI